MEDTIAIVLSDYDIPGQTFVHRHIRELGQGKTVVVSLKAPAEPVRLRPHHTYQPKRLNVRSIRQHGLAFFGDRSSKELERFLRENNVNCVLAEFGYAGLAVYKEAKRLGIPMFCYFRGADASRWLTSAKYARRLRRMMPDIAGIFAVSEFLVSNLKKHGISHPNTHVVPSGVDTRLFVPGAKTANSIVSVGRLIGKKGHDISIRAFAAVAGEFPDARLEIVGDGELLQSCRNLAEELGVGDRVLFHGHRDSAFIQDLLGTAEIYLQHSVTDAQGETEGMPTAIQEAMAAGTVVISTRHAGIPEHLVDGANGFLVDEYDLDDYIAKLQLVLRDWALRQAVAAAARDYAVNRLDYRIGYRKVESVLDEHRG